jgi:hypothetical protein
MAESLAVQGFVRIGQYLINLLFLLRRFLSKPQKSHASAVFHNLDAPDSELLTKSVGASVDKVFAFRCKPCLAWLS